MKHVRKVFTLVILLVTPLLLSGNVVPVDFDAKTTLDRTPVKISLPSYEVISPIIALNDTAMDYYASLYTWEGNGQPDTPYIIEGYNITSDVDCINIEQTSRAFEIRNCYLSSWSGDDGDGIDIYNATQGAAFDTVIEGKSNGIIAYYTPALVIDNCTIRESGYGIEFDYSHSGQITGCLIYENTQDGIYLYHSNDTTIDDNEIYDCESYGAALSSSHHSIIENNLIAYCGYAGLDIGSSHYVVIENNEIHDNDLKEHRGGINLGDSPYASVVGNEIYNNTRNGIYLDGSDWAYIFDNEIYGNSDHGIYAINTDNSTISQNNVYDNGWEPWMPNAMCGVYLGGATMDWVVSENSIWNNTPCGITLEGSSRTLIENNDIFDNAEEGINVFNSAAIKIFENRVFGNGWDVVNTWEGHGIITAGNVADSRIEGNEVFNNTHYGIYAYGNRIMIVGNEVYDHAEWGIGAIMAHNDTVSENIVYDNAFGIYVYSLDTNVTDNIVFDNDWGIFLYGSGDCLLYENDIGWNTINAQENNSAPTNMWYDPVTETGNHWSDLDGDDYYISNGTEYVNNDSFPSKSLDLNDTISLDFEILETGNVFTWEAYALNPSYYEVFVDGESVLVEEWNGGDVEFVADGFAHGLHSVELQVYHVSNHYLGSTTSASVEDLTPPSDIEGPSHIIIDAGLAVDAQYSTEDPSGFRWSVNDTVNFAIDSSGRLTSITDLPVGEYVVQITATDQYDHSTTYDVTITVNAIPGLPPTVMLMIGAGGGIVVLVVLIIGYKTKRG